MSIFTPQPPRLLSNKENTLFASSSSHSQSISTRSSFHHLETRSSATSSKVRIPGIGIGPSPRRRQATSQVSGGKHAKPYSRNTSTSVQRAKKSSAGAAGSVHSQEKEKKRPQSLLLAQSSLKSSATTTSRSTRTLKSSFLPSPVLPAPSSTTTSAPNTLATTDASIPTRTPREVRIPLRLPKPFIPPVTNLHNEALAKIPIEYILPRILPRLPSLGIVSSLYRPYPGYNLPSTTSIGTDTAAERSRPTIAFGISTMVEGKDENGSVASRVAGREPDLCLAIGKYVEGSGCNAGGKRLAGRRLVPVNKIVFATQSAFWDRLCVPILPPTAPSRTGTGTGLGSADAPASSASTGSASASASMSRPAGPTPASAPTPQEQQQSLDTIAEEPEVDTSSSPQSDKSMGSSDDGTIHPYNHENDEDSGEEGGSCDFAETSFESDTTLHPDSESIIYPPSMLHLPIAFLDIPSPETYSALHNLMHFAAPFGVALGAGEGGGGRGDAKSGPIQASTTATNTTSDFNLNDEVNTTSTPAPEPTSSPTPIPTPIPIPQIASLLGLSSTLKSHLEIQSALAALPLSELMSKLDRIHGVWKNVCFLGVGNDGVWRAMGAGWGLVMGVVQGRSTGGGASASESASEALKEEQMDESA